MSSSGQSLALFYHDVGVFISSTRLSISTPYAAFFVTSVSISTMLTHDVEPVIDTLKSVRRLFSNQVTASCLRLSAGVIEELPVNDGDIMTFMQICKSITASADCEEIIKLIYLRRYFEIVDERGDAYQLLSNLFHRRVAPLDYREPAAAG
ncbi:hypothetical protein ABM813_005122, partial [Escherichia coli]|nr:hypothetical protein [Escherichia coli]EIY5954362.1 hypothetical protein [Escherichia coli]